MSNRKFGGKLRKALIDCILNQCTVTHFFQRQPSTFIRVELWLGSSRFEGLGFAKVSWPDEWDAEFGEMIARDKACADIANQISRRDDAFVFVEALGINIDGQLEGCPKVVDSLVPVGS